MADTILHPGANLHGLQTKVWLNIAGEEIVEHSCWLGESSDEWSREWLEVEWWDLADGAATTNDWARQRSAGRKIIQTESENRWWQSWLW